MHVHAQENAPATKRSTRKRGAPAAALDAITEEVEPDENAGPEPEVTAQAEAALQAAPDSTAQEAGGAKGKPPLPSRARRGRAAKKEEGEPGKQSNSNHDLIWQYHNLQYSVPLHVKPYPATHCVCCPPYTS